MGTGGRELQRRWREAIGARRRTKELQRTQQTQQTREMGDKPWQLAPYKALKPPGNFSP